MSPSSENIPKLAKLPIRRQCQIPASCTLQQKQHFNTDPSTTLPSSEPHLRLQPQAPWVLHEKDRLYQLLQRFV